MSDSYVLGRSKAEVKRRKPPKRPRGQCPYLLPELLLLAAALLYYVAATQAHQMLLVGLYGLAALLGMRNLILWRQWRAWSAWTGEAIERVSRTFLVFDCIFVVYIWAYTISKLT